MGSFTTQILVGSGDSNHGGIYPTHFMYLSENDRPAWILMGQNVFDNAEK
jgi:hypothetical protein|tara:strand:- start:147 stop:296 length:150 start_codon:yes stop_codon:yes gene_type:complete